MRKGDDGEEEKKRGEKKKIKTFLEATNVVASRPPKRRPTGTPTARANEFHTFRIFVKGWSPRTYMSVLRQMKTD